jgi:hypothetical protein
MNLKTILSTIFCLFQIVSIAQVNLNTGLISYIPMDGTGNDFSGNNNGATLSNSGVYPSKSITGIESEALLFNGAIEQGMGEFSSSPLNGLSSCALSFWFKLSSITNGMSLVGQDNLLEVGFYTSPNRITVFHPTSMSQSYNLTVSTEQWMHIAINCSPTGMQVFINGIQVGNQNGNHSLGTNATPTRIGGNVVNTANNSWLRGALDEVRIYSRTLNLDEINVLSAAVGVGIAVGNIASTSYCAGSAVSIPYTVSGTGIQTGNTFTAQLSDVFGNFAGSTDIGSVVSSTSGNINATIPANLPSGNAYKLRVVAENAPVIGTQSTFSLTISNPTQGLSTLSRGRILHYQFNGNSNDASPSGANATANGGFSYVNDRFGNSNSAIRLNGSNAFVDVPDRNWFNGVYSTSCWINPEAFGSYARIYDFGNGQGSDNVLTCLSEIVSGRLASQNYSGSSGGTLLTALSGAVLNRWNHVAVTYDGVNIRIYLNGNLLIAGPSASPRLIMRTVCYIGRSNWSTDAFTQASIDDFMLWNRVITTDEIRTLASDGLIDTNSPVCVGSTLQLLAPTQTDAQYSWSGPNSFAASGSAALIPTVVANASGNYGLTISLNGCNSGTLSTAVQVLNNATPPTVTISGLPAATNTLAAASTLTGTPTGGYFSGLGVLGNTFNPGVTGEGNFVVLYNVQGAATCNTTVAGTVLVGASFTMQNGTVNACSGGFFDSGGPAASYGPNEDLVQTFCSSNGQRLRFDFSAMNLGTGDTLFAYDGNSVSASLLRMYIPFSTPDAIWSSGTCITFRWKSNGSAETSGWQAQFECLSNPETAVSISMNTGISAVCNATILDPQGNSNYSQGFTRHTFKSATGSRLRFTYSVFAINGNNGGHWLRIYDGPNQTYPLIGQYNNFNFIPAELVSSGEFLTFEFDANNTAAGFGGNAGFIGLLSCFDEPLDIYTFGSAQINACSGVFYDEGGPNANYSSDLDQEQVFCAPAGEKVRLNFNQNEIGFGTGDSLFVYDGSSITAPLLSIFVQSSAMEPMKSSGSCLTLIFKSDGSSQSQGWQGFINCVPQHAELDTFNISSGLRITCNAIVSDNSRAFAYGQGFNRQTYKSYGGERLRFEYSLFSINGNNGGHWLRIYDGPDQSYPLIGAYNNFNFIPAIIESTGEYLTFEFDRNNTAAGFGSAQGYSGLMTCFGEALPIYTIGNSSINVCEGVFYDDGGPNVSYQADGDYVQTFCSESGQLLQIQFNRNESSFGSGDTLWVYDGASINDSPLAMYIAGSIIETLTSTGTCLTFKFTSNSSSQARGWQGLILCVNEPPAIINYAMSTGIRYVCNGVFRDPGGTSDYPDGTWNQTFTSYSGERLRAVVSGININGNNGGHWIRVYDGPSTASPLIGSYNNFNGWPPAFESTGSSLTFRFESTNTFAGNTSGFEFVFSCFTNAAIDVEWLPSPICRGSEIQIPFTLNDPVNSGNVFTAQLSDANGSFANAVNIGSLSSIEDGVIDATIPLSAIEGAGYRIRVISSNPVQLGSVNPNNLIINPTPNQPASIQSTNGTTICANESTVLSIASQVGVSYSWLLNGQAVGANNNSIEVTNSGTYTIQLSNSCGSITSTANLQLSTTPIPSTPIISGPQNAAICQGGEAQLSTPNQNGVSFSWTLNGSSVGGNFNTINASEAGPYLVSASNTCGSSNAVSSYNLIVEDVPEINLTELQEVSCFGGNDGSIDLEIAGATQIIWSNGSQLSDISNLSSGNYSITASSLAGCESEMTYSISEPNAIVVLADAMPETGNSSNGSITLLLSGGTPPYSFNWSNGESTQDIQGLQSGTYTVEVTDLLGCSFEGSFIVDIVTSMATFSSEFTIMPNPCTEFFFIESEEELVWQLFDSSGRMVLSNSLYEGRNHVSVSHLSSGLYLLNAVSGKGEYSLKRLVIQ